MCSRRLSVKQQRDEQPRRAQRRRMLPDRIERRQRQRARCVAAYQRRQKINESAKSNVDKQSRNNATTMTRSGSYQQTRDSRRPACAVGSIPRRHRAWRRAPHAPVEARLGRHVVNLAAHCRFAVCRAGRRVPRAPRGRRPTGDPDRLVGAGAAMLGELNQRHARARTRVSQRRDADGCARTPPSTPTCSFVYGRGTARAVVVIPPLAWTGQRRPTNRPTNRSIDRCLRRPTDRRPTDRPTDRGSTRPTDKRATPPC